MTFDEIIATAIELITKNKIDECLILVASNLKDQNTDEIILLQRRFTATKEKSQQGLTLASQYEADISLFATNLLSYIKGLSSDQFKESTLSVSGDPLVENPLIERLLDATKEIENLKAQLEINKLRNVNQSFTVRINLQCEKEIIAKLDQFKCKCQIYDDENNVTIVEPNIINGPGGPTITLKDIKPDNFIEVQLLNNDSSIKIKGESSFSPKHTGVIFKSPKS